MTKHVRLSKLAAPLSRRQVMVGAAGLTFAVALSGKAASAATAATQASGNALSPWVSIAPDGTITTIAGSDTGSIGWQPFASIPADKMQLRGSGLAIGPVMATTQGPNGGLRIEATAREPFAAPDIFVEGAPGDAFAAPRITTAEGGRRLVAEIDRILGLFENNSPTAPEGQEYEIFWIAGVNP